MEDGEFKGFTIGRTECGKVVSLSSQSRRDPDRWEIMPSVESFPDVQQIDLYKCRYIQSLHESISDCHKLRSLSLIRCSRLKSIPASIRQLESLQEVRRFFSLRIFYFIFISNIKTISIKAGPDRFIRDFEPSGIPWPSKKVRFCPTFLSYY
jgi:hypothetical protein